MTATRPDTEPAPPLLEVRSLTKRYASARQGAQLRRPPPLTAVDDVSLVLRRGRTLALVGESGSGKSTLARCVLRLTDPSSGRVILRGTDITELHGRSLRPYRRQMQIIFQDPRASFDPRMSIGSSLDEPLRVHTSMASGEREQAAADMLSRVGLPDLDMDRFPHELSGGQLQRVAIARALLLEPDLLVCDEPVSALDVSIQAQVTQLLSDLQQQLDIGYLFIAHDLAVVREFAHDVAVMLDGRIVERGTVQEIFTSAQHEYTQRLLEASLAPHP